MLQVKTRAQYDTRFLTRCLLGVDTQIDKLKASFHNIESQIKDIRLKALSSKELSIQEVREKL